jgi:hypothetical protein
MGTPDNSTAIAAAQTSHGNMLLPTKEMLTQQQVDCLLGIAGHLRFFINVESEETDDAVDGGVHCAAVATVIKVMDRLDSILDDPKRWDMTSQSRLMDSITELYAQQNRLYAAQVEFTVTQTESARQLQRPSFKLRPEIAEMDGQFVAYWGNIDVKGRAIFGLGKTPNEALVDFDKAFDRATNEQVYLISETLDQPKPAPEDKPSIQTPEDFAKKKRKKK